MCWKPRGPAKVKTKAICGRSQEQGAEKWKILVQMGAEGGSVELGRLSAKAPEMNERKDVSCCLQQGEETRMETEQESLSSRWLSISLLSCKYQFRVHYHFPGSFPSPIINGFRLRSPLSVCTVQQKEPPHSSLVENLDEKELSGQPLAYEF